MWAGLLSGGSVVAVVAVTAIALAASGVLSGEAETPNLGVVPACRSLIHADKLNYVVILANQGMPISASAAARVGFSGQAAQQLVLRGKHFIAHGQRVDGSGKNDR